MHHAMPHAATWPFLLLIPLLVWVRLRRARRATQAADFWFEPEGDHFIYHPFGRFGAAYLVSPATRDAIRTRSALLARAVALIFVLIAAGPILVMSYDLDLYMAWRPLLVPVRLGAILLLVAGSLLWRFLAVRPLYAGAPLAPRRIDTQTIRAKQAAARSWWGIVLSCALLGSAALFMARLAFTTNSTAYSLYATLIAVLALLNMRMLVTKWRHRARCK